MKRAFFSLFLSLALLGCKSNVTQPPNTPLSGIRQFEVALFFSPYEENLDREALFKMAIDSFEKIGNVHVVDGNIYANASASSILLLSYGMKGKNTGSIDVFAETEILVNRYRIGTRIWNRDFNVGSCSVVPEIQDGQVIFRQSQKTEKDISLQEMTDQMIQQFARAYNEGNRDKLTFHIYAEGIFPSEIISKD